MKRLALIPLLIFSLLHSYSQEDFTKYVDPTIGNVARFLVPTFPTIHLPNQMVRMIPDKKDYIIDQVTAFPLNVPSHRWKKFFNMKIYQGTVDQKSWKCKMAIDHDLETYKPWFYETYLIEQDVKVAYVPVAKGGVFKIDFKNNEDRHLLFTGQYLKYGSSKEVIELEETLTIKDRGVNPETRSMQMYAHVKLFDEYGKAIKYKIGGLDHKLDIQLSNNSSNTVYLYYSISYIDQAQASVNYKKELANKSFDELINSGKLNWEKVINQIQVKGATEAQKRTFYTSLYRTYERMVDVSEYGRYYDVHTSKVYETDRPYFVDDWIWDTYRAQHPLRTILNPEQETDMLHSYVQMYKHRGWLPTFPRVTGNHMCMNAYHSSAIFIDGYRKGLMDYDVQGAYEGVKKNLTEGTFIPWRQGTPRLEIDDFLHEKGYFPALDKGEEETIPMMDGFEKRQPVPVTLGASYDFWALGEFAKELGNQADYEEFSKKGKFYKNLWSTEHKLFIPKNEKGEFLDIDPKKDGGPGYRHYYDENNGWTYAWDVQHDIQGLIGLLGGKENAEARLDQLFREPLGMRKSQFFIDGSNSTGMVGQFSMGNEPSFHIPYLYNHFGAAWKTQQKTRFLLDVWFKDNLFGIPGDEDGGGMTAFVVFTSLGLYPVTPGEPYYDITSPIFEESTIDLTNGKQFKVIAKGANKRNKYIQEAYLNGEKLTEPKISHKDVMEGGTLELILDELPNKQWGRGEKKL